MGSKPTGPRSLAGPIQGMIVRPDTSQRPDSLTRNLTKTEKSCGFQYVKGITSCKHIKLLEATAQWRMGGFILQQPDELKGCV